MLRISWEWSFITEIVALDSTQLVSLVKFVGDHLDNVPHNTVCAISQVTLGPM